jgi:hydrogenase nickel incorporation protein HypB
MCDTCGCDQPSRRTIASEEQLIAVNGPASAHNRDHFKRAGIFAVNLMGAPGAGKTALLEATIQNWRGVGRISVIEGDQSTQRDSERVRRAGADSVQVETGLGCHLDATQVHHALHHLSFHGDDVVFIENVGNLVCPALFDLGENLRVLVTSPTEGVDKPLKYPPIFRAADIIVLNKCDLLAAVRFQLDEWKEYIAAVNPRSAIILTSALTGAGLDMWIEEIEQRRQATR